MNKKNLLYFPPYYTLYLKERTIFEIIKNSKTNVYKRRNRRQKSVHDHTTFKREKHKHRLGNRETKVWTMESKFYPIKEGYLDFSAWIFMFPKFPLNLCKKT